MASITINGNTYQSLDSGFTSATKELVAGVYYALPPYGEAPRITSAETEQKFVSFTGIDGEGSVGCGFRGRNIEADLVVANATKSGCEGAIETLLTSIAPVNGRFTVAVPGGASFQGCQLIRGAGEVKGWFTVGNMVCAKITLKLRQRSTTN